MNQAGIAISYMNDIPKKWTLEFLSVWTLLLWNIFKSGALTH
jgi:hypothetical protein